MLKDSGEQRNTDKLRHEYSRVIETLFARYDVLLTPVSPVLAFAHMQQPVRKRKLIVNGEPQDYNEHLFWNMLATVLVCLPPFTHWRKRWMSFRAAYRSFPGIFTMM